MKFAEHLGAHITPEWRKQYIQYELMKEMLYEAQEESPSVEEKISEANRKYASLKAELETYTEHAHKPSTMSLRRRRPSGVALLFKDKEKKGMAHTRKLHDLKLAFSEFYLSLILLQNYQTLNFTGFRKILKKHDKSSVTSDLEGGNRQKAMKRLRVPPLGDEQNPWTTFRVGLFSGIFVVLALVVLIAAFFTDHSKDWQPALIMYRGMFLVILDIFLLGINTYGWRSSGVNHLATFLASLWAISVLLYLFSPFLMIPTFVFPLSLAGFLMLYLINPFPFRIFTAPFHHVGFADFWLADQLNSLVTVLLDFEYMVCFYAFEVDWLGNTGEPVCTKSIYGIRAIVSCLPAWFRFAQCLRRYRDTKLKFPHLVNAGKYSTSFLTALFSTLYSVQKELYGDSNRQNHAFFYLWIIASVIGSCYTLTWDLKMDWGILDKDFVLRFVWTLTVSVGEGKLFHGEALKTLLASLEVFRRFVWNFFRLENEHLNNCGQFRAVRDISIAPIDSNDQSQLEDMMDDEDGAYTRMSERRKLLGNNTKFEPHVYRLLWPNEKALKKLNKKDKSWLDEDQKEKIPWKFKGV
ncbi:hypothetical protein KUTeg_021410 [Tegillarca granosa]|uniref:Xenotropic and polytropic retrovirus receptor 1 n=1 Tax=Tegillarca granosa TaxID=220873 RepID=A0ABQ9E7Y5_TEGGR|nr:hypothetical protein KUTeg_021410 [Tegillarca granosa]